MIWYWLACFIGVIVGIVLDRYLMLRRITALHRECEEILRQHEQSQLQIAHFLANESPATNVDPAWWTGELNPRGVRFAKWLKEK